MSLFFIWFVFTVFNSSNEAARILAVFPAPSISHQAVFRPLTQELAKRGHKVVVITSDLAFPKGKSPENLTEIDAHDVLYAVKDEDFLSVSRNVLSDTPKCWEMIIKSFAKLFDKHFNVEEVKELIDKKENKFDLVLVETCIRPLIGYFHVFKAPIITISSYGAPLDSYETFGVSEHPNLYPSVISKRIYNKTNLDTLTETYNYFEVKGIFKKNINHENKLLKRHFGNDVPSIDDLVNNLDMLFLNINPIFEGIRPVPNSIVYMGGLHQKPEKELPADLKSYLDSSKHGVIYFSLGTNVTPNTLPENIFRSILAVFSKSRYDVIIKSDGLNFTKPFHNIRTSKWLPQPDLLRHPKVKFFITQGGLQSTDEAITAGVPLIGIPIFADQWFNVEKYLIFKIGVRIDLDSITEDSFREAIDTVISEKSYKQNVIKLRELINDQPQRPLERAVMWMEHVLRRSGAKHLRSSAANISWVQYFELQLVLTLLTVFIILSTLLMILLFKLYRVLRRITTITFK